MNPKEWHSSALFVRDPMEQKDAREKTIDYEKLRRWKRYPVILSLRARVPTKSGVQFVDAHGRDISQGGMAVYVPAELERGQSILLQLTFPGLPQPLNLLALVKNRVGSKYGVEFVNPTPYQQGVIISNLEKLLAARSESP